MYRTGVLGLERGFVGQGCPRGLAHRQPCVRVTMERDEMKKVCVLCFVGLCMFSAATQAGAIVASAHVAPSAARDVSMRLAAAQPRLQLSVTRAKAGAHVRVLGVNCPRPKAGPDELTWHDSYQLTHRFARPPFRKLQGLHRTGETIMATFTVLKGDHLGRGLLDLFCGGNRGNAIAYLDVIKD